MVIILEGGVGWIVDKNVVTLNYPNQPNLPRQRYVF